MNEETGRNRGRGARPPWPSRPPSPSWPRRAAVVPRPRASPPTYAQELALAQCMRGHGVPNFPDPGASGGYCWVRRDNEGAGGSATSTAARQAAYGALPASAAGRPSVSQLEQMAQQGQQRRSRHSRLVKFAQCMRSHGVPGFPAPRRAARAPRPGQGRAINPSSPGFQAAVQRLSASVSRGRVRTSRSTSAAWAAAGHGARPGGRRARVVAAVLVVVLGAGAGIGWAAGAFGRMTRPGPGRGRRRRRRGRWSGRICRRLTPVNATLGYAKSYTVRGPGGGALTWLPSAGQVIGQGHALYRVDNASPVVLLYGPCRPGGPWMRV